MTEQNFVNYFYHNSVKPSLDTIYLKLLNHVNQNIGILNSVTEMDASKLSKLNHYKSFSSKESGDKTRYRMAKLTKNSQNEVIEIKVSLLSSIMGPYHLLSGFEMDSVSTTATNNVGSFVYPAYIVNPKQALPDVILDAQDLEAISLAMKNTCKYYVDVLRESYRSLSVEDKTSSNYQNLYPMVGEELNYLNSQYNEYITSDYIFKTIKTKVNPYNYVSEPFDINPITEVMGESVNLIAEMSPSELLALQEDLRLLPRNEFNLYIRKIITQSSKNPDIYGKDNEYFDSKGISHLDIAYGELNTLLTFSILLEVFNKANSEEMIKQGLVDAFEWEFLKLKAYKKKDINKEFEELTEKINEDPLLAPQYDKKRARIYYESRIENLPKIGDDVIQFNRTIALSSLLQNEDFEELERFLGLYENLPQQWKDKLKEL